MSLEKSGVAHMGVGSEPDAGEVSPSLEDNIAFAINVWFADEPVVVPDALDALIGTIASIAVRAGCTTPERRSYMADHVRTNVLSALEYYASRDHFRSDPL